MLAEFFKALQAQAAVQHKLEIVPVPGDERRAYVVHGGKHEAIDIDPPPINDTVRSFADFCELAASRRIGTPAVYFDEKSLIAIYDGEDRRDRTTMPLEYAERWSSVLKLGDGVSLSQKEAIHFLRFGLGVDRLDKVLFCVRKLDFLRTSTGKATTEHGRESLGKSVEMTVQQADQIPEDFDVTVAPLASRGLTGITVTICVGVVLDLEQQRIVFRAMPDSIRNARNALLGAVQALLVDEAKARSADDSPAFLVIHGSP